MLSYIKREEWATEKMRENKRAKSSSVQKRDRERKRKVTMPSQKEAGEGKLIKGVPLPPNVPHTCTS